MGENISKKLRSMNECAQIYLQLDRPFYYAGDTINGTVYLNVLNNYPLKGIFLRLKGKEKVNFQTQHTESRTQTQTTGNATNTNTTTQTIMIDHRGENVVLNLQCPLFSFPNIITTGQYSFPFRFTIPEHVPGTFEVKGVSEAFSRIKLARIKFIMAVRMESMNPSIISNLEYKTEIKIRPLFDSSIINTLAKKLDSNVTQCCASKGHCSLNVTFEKGIYALGEEVNILADADNRSSSIPISSIRAILKQTIKIRANHTNPQQETIENIVAQDEKMAHIMPGSQMQSPVNLKFRISNPFLKDSKGVSMVQPTIQRGILITCTYTLIVYISFEGCCVFGPEVNFDVFLYSPEFQPPPMPQQPPNWNPYVFSVGVCSITGNQLTISGIAPPTNMPSIQADMSINMNVNTNPINMNMGFEEVNMNMQVGNTALKMDIGGMEMEAQMSNTNKEGKIDYSLKI